MPFLLPNQQRQSTEGTDQQTDTTKITTGGIIFCAYAAKEMTVKTTACSFKV